MHRGVYGLFFLLCLGAELSGVQAQYPLEQRNAPANGKAPPKEEIKIG